MKSVLSKEQLKNRLKRLKIIKQATASQPPIFNVKPFCMNCGSESFYYINHGVLYPEIWVTAKCKNCHAFIGEADNSRFVYALEEYIQENEK